MKPIFVVLARDLADAVGEGQRLWDEEPERMQGREIVVVLMPSWKRRLEGLRVHDYAITEEAKRHREFSHAHECLAFARVLTEAGK